MKSIILKQPEVQAIQGGAAVLWRPVKLTEFQKTDTKGYDWIFRDKGYRWNDVSNEKLLNNFCPYQVGEPY